MEKTSSRLKVLAVLVAFMFAALGTRLWFLQVLAAQTNLEQAQAQSKRFVPIDAPRGLIFTSDRVALVNNRRSLEVRVNNQTLTGRGVHRADAELLRLSKVLKIPVKQLHKSINDVRYLPYQPKPVAEFVGEKVAAYLSERQAQFPGVTVVQTTVRDYPLGETAAHVVGYLGQIDAQQLKEAAYKGYGSSDLVGKAGLELQYEKYLHGRKGRQAYVVDSQGKVIRPLSSTPARPGDNLILTINSKIQQDVELDLHNGIMNARNQIDVAGNKGLYLKANAGAAVVMDVRTGGIVAMASWPTYHPSWFVKGLTTAQSNYLFKCTCAPSLNRTMQQNYKPGSTFKPVVALTAVKEGIASLSGGYDCPAVYKVPGDKSGTQFDNWSTTNLGFMSIAHALQVSCDTVFDKFGDDFWNRWRQNAFGTNNEPFQRDLRQWGFANPTGVDLPGEVGGVIPDAKFAAQNPATYPFGWTPGGNILLAIGSGDTLVTPLQMADAYSAIANGGHLCHPHVVDKIVDSSGHTVKALTGRCNNQLPYTQTELSYIRQALATVPLGGTATSAFAGFPLSQYPIAGKTGTAERPPFQSTSWFSSFAPANDPKYAVVVMVEQGGYGSQTAAPIVRHIYEHLFGLPLTGIVNGGAAD